MERETSAKVEHGENRIKMSYIRRGCLKLKCTVTFQEGENEILV